MYIQQPSKQVTHTTTQWRRTIGAGKFREMEKWSRTATMKVIQMEKGGEENRFKVIQERRCKIMDRKKNEKTFEVLMCKDFPQWTKTVKIKTLS